MNTSWQQSYSHYAATLPGQQLQWLKKLRLEHFEKFTQQGFPTTRMEEWKYTNLSPLSKKNYIFSEQENTAPIDLPSPLINGIRLVFINGYFNNALSNLNHHEKIFAGSFAQALESSNTTLLHHLEKNKLAHHSTMTSFNLSCMADGALIILEDDCPDVSIEICFYNTADQQKKIIQPRNIILCGQKSQATIIERYCGDNETAHFTNSVTELYLGADAHIQHIKLQTEPQQAVHVGQLYIHQEHHSQFKSYVLSYGGTLVRNQIHSLLDAPEAQTALYGLFIAANHQHMDQHTTIEHLKPKCTSHEFYRGILFDHARGVFNGNVIAHPLAEKTCATQINNNLLLSKNAEIDTKPELQIYTDDIQCSHAATVGKLDEQALFYLRARGIGHDEAKNLLIYTFAAEILHSIADAHLRHVLQEQILDYLPATHALQEILHAI